ncbi:Hypothetical protein FSTVST1_278 [Faustovirus ST1]|nr:Hypothetical protein FSTVST1_278 [Faustovirus ST1]
MDLKIKILICVVVLVCIVVVWYLVRANGAPAPPQDAQPPAYVDGMWVMRYTNRGDGPYTIKRRDGNIYCHGVPSQGEQVGYCIKDLSNESINAANAAIASGAADPLTELLMCSGGATYCPYKI